MVNVVGINPSPQARATPPGPSLRPLGTLPWYPQLQECQQKHTSTTCMDSVPFSTNTSNMCSMNGALSSVDSVREGARKGGQKLIYTVTPQGEI